MIPLLKPRSIDSTSFTLWTRKLLPDNIRIHSPLVYSLTWPWPCTHPSFVCPSTLEIGLIPSESFTLLINLAKLGTLKIRNPPGTNTLEISPKTLLGWMNRCSKTSVNITQSNQMRIIPESEAKFRLGSPKKNDPTRRYLSGRDNRQVLEEIQHSKSSKPINYSTIQKPVSKNQSVLTS